MRTRRGLIVLSILLCGCVPSLYPLYTDEDVIFDPNLVGVWSEKDAKDKWAFSQEDNKTYKLVYTDEKGLPGEFIVHLVNVQDRLFLDLFPADPNLKENDFYKAHLLPAHTFMKVEHINATLRMAPMNPDWLNKYLEDHPDAIAHEKVDDRIVLTAKPKVIQAFLIKNEKTEGLFGDMSDLIKQESQ